MRYAKYILLFPLIFMVQSLAQAQEQRISEIEGEFSLSVNYFFEVDSQIYVAQRHYNDSISVYRMIDEELQFLHGSHWGVCPDFVSCEIRQTSQSLYATWNGTLYYFDVLANRSGVLSIDGFLKDDPAVSAADNSVWLNDFDTGRYYQFDIANETLSFFNATYIHAINDQGIYFSNRQSNILQNLNLLTSDGDTLLLGAYTNSLKFSATAHDFAWYIDGDIQLRSNDGDIKVIATDLQDSFIDRIYSDDRRIYVVNGIEVKEIDKESLQVFSYEVESLNTDTKFISRYDSNVFMFKDFGIEKFNLNSKELTVPGGFGFGRAQHISDRYFTTSVGGTLFDAQSDSLIALPYNFYVSSVLELSHDELVLGLSSLYSSAKQPHSIKVISNESSSVIEELPLLSGINYGLSISLPYVRESPDLYLVSEDLIHVYDNEVHVIGDMDSRTILNSEVLDGCIRYTIEQNDSIFIVKNCNDIEHVLFASAKSSVVGQSGRAISKGYIDGDTIALLLHLSGLTSLRVLKKIDLVSGDIINLGPFNGNFKDVLFEPGGFYAIGNDALLWFDNSGGIFEKITVSGRSSLDRSGNRTILWTENRIMDVLGPDDIQVLATDAEGFYRISKVNGLVVAFSRSGDIYALQDGELHYYPLKADNRLFSDFGEYAFFHRAQDFELLNTRDGSRIKVDTSDIEHIWEVFISPQDTFMMCRSKENTRVLYRMVDNQLEVFDSELRRNTLKGAYSGGKSLVLTEKAYLLIDENRNIDTLDVDVPYTLMYPVFHNSAFYFIGIHPAYGNQVYYLPISSDPNATHEPIPLIASPLSVYPNPASTHITIACPDCPDQPTRYEIRALDGHLLSQGSFLPDESINIAQLPAGPYVITIHPDGLPHISASFIK